MSKMFVLIKMPQLKISIWTQNQFLKIRFQINNCKMINRRDYLDWINLLKITSLLTDIKEVILKINCSKKVSWLILNLKMLLKSKLKASWKFIMNSLFLKIV